LKFYGLMLVRDEQDVIRDCLDELLKWMDGVYIWDLGSTDGTVDLLHDYARRDKRVVLHESRPILYDRNLRHILFEKYRSHFRDGDWILRLDADEIYHVPPPVFVKERLEPYEGRIDLQWYFFRLTENEVNDYESGRVDLAQDRSRSITDRRRYYKLSQFNEPRMFKYRGSIKWPHWASFPIFAGVLGRERLPVRHYPHRDPLQMRARFRLRLAMKNLNARAGEHWRIDDWRQEVVNELGISISQKGGTGLHVEPGMGSGDLLLWEPGSTLLERPLHNHALPRMQRILYRMHYASMVSMLDRFRPGYDPTFLATPLSPDVQAAAAKATALDSLAKWTAQHPRRMGYPDE